MIVVLVNSCRKVRFKRKELLCPPSGPREEEKSYCEDRSRQRRRCHNRLTVIAQAGMADSIMALYVLQPRPASDLKNSLQILAPIARIFL